MRHAVFAAAGVWLALIAVGLGARLPVTAERLPGAWSSAEGRAALRSGSEAYHKFLRGVAEAAPRGSTVLILVHDPSRNDLFLTYRAAYCLYPVPHMYVPVPAPLPAAASFKLDVDERIASAVHGERIAIAGVYTTSPEAGGRVYAIAPAGPRRISFREFRGPAVPPGERGGEFGAARLWLWPAGVLVLAALGWMLSDCLGLAAHCGGSPALRLAFAWLAGFGLTAFWMMVTGIAGMRWTLPLVLLPWAGIVAWWGWRRRWPAPAEAVAASPEISPPPSQSPAREPKWLVPAGIAVVAFTTVLALVEVVIPMSAWGNWDAWAIWNLKARGFWNARTLPVPFLLDLRYDFSHPDYPPGISLLQVYLGLWAGGLSETLLRATSPIWHLALVVLLAGLGRELGLGGERWLAAGAYGLMPRVFEQAHSGYSDIALAAAVAGVLLFLVRATRGEAPPWMVALMCGIAGLVKGEGLILSAGCGALIGLWWLLGRIRFGQAAAAWVLMAALLVPWRATVTGLHIKSTFEISPARMAAQAPVFMPYVVKAAFIDALGPELTVDHLRELGDINPADWLWRQRRNWAGFWYVVATAALVFGWRGLFRPAGAQFVFLLGLQLASTWAVTLGAQYQVIWVLVTSVDRMLLQLSPLGFALGAACVGSVGLWPPPAQPPAPKSGSPKAAQPKRKG